MAEYFGPFAPTNPDKGDIWYSPAVGAGQVWTGPNPADGWKLIGAGGVDSTAVHQAGAETVSGPKTFTAIQTFTNQLRESNATGITAGAGAGGQGGATALTAMFNRVTVSAATAVPFDGVALPASAAGLDIIIVNATNNPIQVYGNGTDTINGQASATGITQAPNSVESYMCTAAGLWNVDPGIGYSGQLFTELSQDNIVARAGGGQALATQLWAQTSRVATVATIGDSVKLPASAPGLEILLVNHGAMSMQVYGAGTDTIDDVATATGVAQMAGSMVIYSCTTAGQWYSNGIGTGFAGQYPTVSYTEGMSGAGATQGTATPIITVLNRFTTVGAGTGAVLPNMKPGMQITVINTSAAQALAVYPATGEFINNNAVNVAFSIGVLKTATFYCTAVGISHTIISA